MKVYIINDRDIEDLLLRIERDPARNGHVLNATERVAYDDAQRFYNYQLLTWIGKIKESK